MMRDVFVVSDNILSPLGVTTEQNFAGLKKGQSGISWHENLKLSPIAFFASLFEDNATFSDADDSYTKFEQLLIASISVTLKNSVIDIRDTRTALIISSTKGNISLIETAAFNNTLKERIALHQSAKRISSYFNHPNKPVIVSNACISGVLALLTGLRLIQSGQYDHAVVAGCDVITKFILSGFQSFMAVSSSPCKPFDAERDGVTLGEGAATVILSADKKNADYIQLAGGSVSNDANHISGPSRTGEELALAITNALSNANVAAHEIDFISAHGTATLYNDEMEAKAISLTNLETAPVNSLKGNYGHTLGAAGLIESIIAIHSLKENIVLPTKNFNHFGVSKAINICSILQNVEMKNVLKTASGFGGCNGAIVFKKVV
jgi:3-oxoacyl-[acyl-carrier-protein] synthase-1